MELVNILRKFSTLEDEEYAELKNKCIRILLQYGDEEAFRSVLASYRILPQEMRYEIAYRISSEKDFLFRNLPLVKLVARDEDPEVRERMKSFFEKVCEYYSSSKREESRGRKLTILNNSRRNAEMQAFLDEVFTQKYGDQYWTYFLRNFLGSYEISRLFERIPPDKYSIFSRGSTYAAWRMIPPVLHGSGLLRNSPCSCRSIPMPFSLPPELMKTRFSRLSGLFLRVSGRFRNGSFRPFPLPTPWSDATPSPC